MNKEDALHIATETGKYILAYLAASLPWMLLFGTLFFTGGILAVVALRKYRFFHREPKFWNWLVKIYYIGIPLAMLCTGIGFGLVKGALVVAHREAQKADIKNSLAVKNFKSYLDENKELLRQGALDDPLAGFLATMYYPPKSDKWHERWKAKIINYYTLNTAKWMVVSAVSATLVYAGARAGGAIGFSEKEVKVFFDVIKETDLSDFDNSFDQLLDDAVHRVIDKYIKPFYTTVFMYFLPFFAIPLGDFLVYRIYLKDKRDRFISRRVERLLSKK